jgi:hypothetical protein
LLSVKAAAPLVLASSLLLRLKGTGRVFSLYMEKQDSEVHVVYKR